MQFFYLLAILVLSFSHLSTSAKIHSENDGVAMVETIKEQLRDLKKQVLKGPMDERVLWQVEAFQKWYQDKQKCSRDFSYIFDDWTTIQRRIDGSADFNRNWTEYRKGFGLDDGDFFIGLDSLHALTTEKEPQELLILLGDHEGKIAYAKYDSFVVAGEDKKYELQELGNYSGDAGDSLRYHVGEKFSTPDQDNDNSESYSCARFAKGGWWFGFCYESYLNAPYLDVMAARESSKGIIWKSWHGSNYSLKFVHMMIRPKL